MPSRLPSHFAALAARGERALVTFVTAGDPWPDNTAAIVAALADGGADVIEIGVPFSDPLADGPTIQASSQRALDTGMTPPKVLEIVRDARKRGVTVPILLMGAWNPVLQYGIGRFAHDAADAGIDGVILTDLTPEESDDWKTAADAVGLDTIYLLAPTSTEARMALVGARARGFIYCVSQTGITGTQDAVPEALPPLVDAIRAHARGVPICVGFGIRRPDQVAAICRIADGAVIGTALVQLLHEHRDDPNLLAHVTDTIATLKAATK